MTATAPLGQTPPREGAILVVGGTGMLGEVTRELCRRGHVVTATGRSQRRLDELSERCRGQRGTMLAVVADWTDTAGFLRAIDAARHDHPFDAAVVWMHGDRADAVMALAHRVRPDGALLHVRGISSADPHDDAVQNSSPGWPCTYRQVILGFEVDGGRGRWLTHAEISSGVLAAFDGAAPRAVVGCVEPWSARP